MMRRLVVFIVICGGSIVPAASARGATSGFSNQLRKVVCLSTSNCFAVGASQASTTLRPLVEHWNGTAWSLVTLPAPAGSVGMSTDDISCIAPSTCVVAGAATFSTATRPLIERWNGQHWQAQTAAAPTSSDGFASIACTAVTSCMAVGGSTNHGVERPLAERWDGTHWTVLTIPAVDAKPRFALESVACTSATNCFAQGSDYSAGRSTPFVDRWNGTAWSHQKTWTYRPLLRAFGISCGSATDCAIVGEDGTRPFVEYWNGSSWTDNAQAAPQPGQFDGVECAAASCVAVGHDGSNVPRSLAAVETHHTFTRQTTPNPTGLVPTLVSVACPAANSCVAVGSWSSFNAGESQQHVFAERWNGQKWSLQTMVNP
jgi:hypothetical protein